jgi:hypothetical protein
MRTPDGMAQSFDMSKGVTIEPKPGMVSGFSKSHPFSTSVSFGSPISALYVQSSAGRDRRDEPERMTEAADLCRR